MSKIRLFILLIILFFNLKCANKNIPISKNNLIQVLFLDVNDSILKNIDVFLVNQSEVLPIKSITDSKSIIYLDKNLIVAKKQIVFKKKGYRDVEIATKYISNVHLNSLYMAKPKEDVVINGFSYMPFVKNEFNIAIVPANRSTNELDQILATNNLEYDIKSEQKYIKKQHKKNGLFTKESLKFRFVKKVNNTKFSDKDSETLSLLRNSEHVSQVGTVINDNLLSNTCYVKLLPLKHKEFENWINDKNYIKKEGRMNDFYLTWPDNYDYQLIKEFNELWLSGLFEYVQPSIGDFSFIDL